MRLASRSTVVAICLAIFALASAAASARPAFDPPRVAINPSIGYVTPQDKSVSQSPEVRPNPDQQVVLGHHAAPIPPILGKSQAAEQAAIDKLKAQQYTDKLPVNAAYSAAALNGYGSGHPVSVQAQQAPSANPDNGFDWGDAAIGAGAGLSLTLLVLGGALVLSHRRSRPAESTNVATT
jgi:hypothetical protein